MSEEHYKKAYFKEYEESKKLINFIESLESSTNDWDDFCDCELNKGIHISSCRTMYIRKDYDLILKK